MPDSTPAQLYKRGCPRPVEFYQRLPLITGTSWAHNSLEKARHYTTQAVPQVQVCQGTVRQQRSAFPGLVRKKRGAREQQLLYKLCRLQAPHELWHSWLTYQDKHATAGRHTGVKCSHSCYSQEPSAPRPHAQPPVNSPAGQLPCEADPTSAQQLSVARLLQAWPLLHAANHILLAEKRIKHLVQPEHPHAGVRL